MVFKSVKLIVFPLGILREMSVAVVLERNVVVAVEFVGEYEDASLPFKYSAVVVKTGESVNVVETLSLILPVIVNTTGNQQKNSTHYSDYDPPSVIYTLRSRRPQKATTTRSALSLS